MKDGLCVWERWKRRIDEQSGPGELFREVVLDALGGGEREGLCVLICLCVCQASRLLIEVALESEMYRDLTFWQGQGNWVKLSRFRSNTEHFRAKGSLKVSKDCTSEGDGKCLHRACLAARCGCVDADVSGVIKWRKYEASKRQMCTWNVVRGCCWSAHTCISAPVLCANGRKPHIHEKKQNNNNTASNRVAVMKIQQRWRADGPTTSRASHGTGSARRLSFSRVPTAN